MVYKKILFVVAFLMVLHCGLFEPEQKTGSILIEIVNTNTKNSNREDLKKVENTSEANTTLYSVQCVVKKGSLTVYNANLQKSESNFEGTISDLEPGSDYSVYLYGKNSSSEIIARGSRLNIVVSAGQTSTTQITWSAFSPVLSSPANGNSSSNDKPTFDWSDVTGDSLYEIQVSTSGAFATTVLNSNSLTSSSYTASSLSEGTYYWRVRAQDNQGNWGGWSEIWNFTISSFYLSVSTDSLVLESSNNSQSSFAVTSNIDWESSVDANWLSVSPSSGTGDGEITVTTTSANSSTSSRNATVTVSGTGVNSVSVVITQNGSSIETSTMTDQDGNVYATIKIGDQWWMAENLKVAHYRNGDEIPNITDYTEWSKLTTGAFCVYDNDDGYLDTYGCLYNWYAVDDTRNIAPTGWHVPTDEEWKTLEMYLGMSQFYADIYVWRGTDEGGKLKETGTIHWESPNTGATNESGFSCLPGGFYQPTGKFDNLGNEAYFWTATDYNTVLGSWCRYLNYKRSDIARNFYLNHAGMSVRLVKD